MATTYFTDAGTFLIESLFGLYILTIMLRFLFQWLRADFYNPISQFVVKATAPLLRPLRRWIPGVGGYRHGRGDFDVDLARDRDLGRLCHAWISSLAGWFIAFIGGRNTAAFGLCVPDRGLCPGHRELD